MHKFGFRLGLTTIGWLLLALTLCQQAACASVQQQAVFDVKPPNTASIDKVHTCTLSPSSDGKDDSDAILAAFDKCGRQKDGKGGLIKFQPGTYQVAKVMDILGLKDLTVDLQNVTLLFSDDTDYWLQNSISVVFQDQSTAWRLGGENIVIKGGVLDGNGQAWYDQNRNRSNQPGRPIAFTIWQASNVIVDGLRFHQPQFWAAFIAHSINVTMRNVDVSAISTSQWNTVNTDGADTWNAKDILIENWTVESGDDCVAAKGNTTNLVVRNIHCTGGNGMTIGSVGQYEETPDYVDDVLFEYITVKDAFNAAFVKTWQGALQDNSTNGDGGGGGHGHVRNITFRNFDVENVALPIQITQCIYSEGQDGVDCESSKMQVEDVRWQNLTGTTRYNIAASLHCAAGKPCKGIEFDNVRLDSRNHTMGMPNSGVNSQDEVYQCANLVDPVGIPCNKDAPADFGQIVGGNIP